MPSAWTLSSYPYSLSAAQYAWKTFLKLFERSSSHLLLKKITMTRIDNHTAVPERLPVNRALLDMMEEVNTKLDPPKDPILSCVEGSDHKPEVYCKICKEAFCESCFAELHTFKAMKNHTIVSIERICSKHRKTANFICLDHSHESWQRSFCDICQKDCTRSKHNHDSFEGYEAKRRKQLEELLEKIKTREEHACGQLGLFDEYYLTYDEDGVEMENARLDCERNYGAKMWKVLSGLASTKKQHLIEGKTKFDNVLSAAKKYKDEVNKILAKKFDTIDIKKQLSEAYSFVNEEPEELHPLSFYICTGASQQSGSGNKRDVEKEDERKAKMPRIDIV
ncbi:hypothetical protein CAEBREN_22137 [Caenorhabditis brenneri]|uniref:B box-type domain-containing protein n=1 Tax=Caenorhabditis brenneri TaxID=135651 RepID=G0NDD6_CAEBE|nr:hypothetical protein CAEBREN_22137 [Caenorhabditis brenneri]